MRPDIHRESPPPLDKLSIDLPDFTNEGESGTIESKKVEVDYEGNRLSLGIQKQAEYSYAGDNSKVRILIGTSVEDKQAFIKITITRQRDGTYRAGSDVKNEIRDIKRLGRALLEVAMSLIKKMADQVGTPIQHNVYKRPYEKLSPQKWDELFLTLLEKKHGYTKYEDEGEYVWRKVYKPQK